MTTDTISNFVIEKTHGSERLLFGLLGRSSPCSVVYSSFHFFASLLPVVLCIFFFVASYSGSQTHNKRAGIEKAFPLSFCACTFASVFWGGVNGMELVELRGCINGKAFIVWILKFILTSVLLGIKCDLQFCELRR
ncbi:hypothetical protein DL95DRAFT_184240 [Leptodontidium sp. 2 PMI_412]|nr:hypothetical protein DL95DRAFT_184240 [Leptodontidium sp. 2 PMI_412]